MSKTSAKNRYTQLMEWLPTLSKQRKKRSNSKQSNRLLDGFKQGKFKR